MKYAGVTPLQTGQKFKCACESSHKTEYTDMVNFHETGIV